MVYEKNMSFLVIAKISQSLKTVEKIGLSHFKGVVHRLPQKAPKLACFVLYLKIINIFLKNDICIL